MEFAAVIGLIVGFGAVVTKSVDLVRNLVDPAARLPKVTWNVAAFGFGIAYCVGWQLDASASVLALVPALAENSDRLSGLPGQILTGLLAGGAAGFMHETMSALSAVASRRAS